MSQYQKPQVYWPGENRSQKHKTTSKMSHQIVHMAKYRGIVTPWRYNYVRHLRSRHLLTRLSIPRSVDLGFLILWLLRSHSYHSHAIKKTTNKSNTTILCFRKYPKRRKGTKIFLGRPLASKSIENHFENPPSSVWMILNLFLNDFERSDPHPFPHPKERPQPTVGADARVCPQNPPCLPEHLWAFIGKKLS